MWWLVVVLLLLVGSSYVLTRREGLDVGAMEPDDPTVKELLKSNERTLAELNKKVDELASVAEKVTSLKRRIDETNTKLDGIANMCVGRTESK